MLPIHARIPTAACIYPWAAFTASAAPAGLKECTLGGFFAGQRNGLGSSVSERDGTIDREREFPQPDMYVVPVIYLVQGIFRHSFSALLYEYQAHPILLWSDCVGETLEA